MRWPLIRNRFKRTVASCQFVELDASERFLTASSQSGPDVKLIAFDLRAGN